MNCFQRQPFPVEFDGLGRKVLLARFVADA